jgi:hypothetical protein
MGSSPPLGTPAAEKGRERAWSARERHFVAYRRKTHPRVEPGRIQYRLLERFDLKG